MTPIGGGGLGGEPDLLPAWLARRPRERRLFIPDLRRGVGQLPGRVVRGPLVPSRDAGVLVPVFDEGDGLQVVLIERGDVGTHRGDIAFPGGVCEAGELASAAGVREAEEEVGIRPDEVEVVASLSTHPTLNGFVIWPYIGVLTTRPQLRPNPREVARAFIVGVDELLADGAWWRQPWRSDGSHLLDHFAVPGGTAWGTTGDLIRELLEISIKGRWERSSLEERAR